MSKDNELKRPNHNERNKGGDDPAYNQVVSPDTSAPLGYIKDRPMRDKLSEEEVDRKAKGESPGNEVELDLNPNPDTESEDDTV